MDSACCSASWSKPTVFLKGLGFVTKSLDWIFSFTTFRLQTLLIAQFQKEGGDKTKQKRHPIQTPASSQENFEGREYDRRERAREERAMTPAWRSDWRGNSNSKHYKIIDWRGNVSNCSSQGSWLNTLVFGLVNSSIPRGYDCKSQGCWLSSNFQFRTICGVAIYSQFSLRKREKEMSRGNTWIVNECSQWPLSAVGEPQQSWGTWRTTRQSWQHPVHMLRSQAPLSMWHIQSTESGVWGCCFHVLYPSHLGSQLLRGLPSGPATTNQFISAPSWLKPSCQTSPMSVIKDKPKSSSDTAQMAAGPNGDEEQTC